MFFASSAFSDLRYAIRQLRRSPGFAAAAVLTLALGIGANTAVFSLLDQALLRSLPVRNPASLVILEGTGKAWEGSFSSNGGDHEAYFSVPMYRNLRDENRAFSGLIASAPADIGVAHAGHSEAARAELVSGNYFSVLGVQPALGRVFTEADDTAPGANSVAVLSFDFWRDHLGADSTLIGSTLSVNGQPFQIVGVAAPQFRSAIWGESPSLFVPMSMSGEIVPGAGKRLKDHTDRWINILGRLKPGVSRAQAQAATQPLWHALRADEHKALGHPTQHFTDEFLTNSRLLVKPGARGFSYQRGRFETPLLAIMAMAILVLLIASVNVASLLLVRSAGRVREFSLRFALGAAVPRIVRQLLVEGILIGAVGGLAGIALAPLAIRLLLRQLNADQTDAWFSSALDFRLLAFTFVVALAVSVFFSLAPAIELRRPDLTRALRESTGTPTGGTFSLRRVVVSLQIGLSVLLLVGAGLFVRTMQKLRAVDVGFNTTHLVTFGIDPKLSGYASAAIPALEQRVIERLSVLPGVEAVGPTPWRSSPGTVTAGTSQFPAILRHQMTTSTWRRRLLTQLISTLFRCPFSLAVPSWMKDNATGQKVAIVNQTFVKHFCGGDVRSCLGRQMSNSGGDRVKLNTEIVGIVRDARHTGVRDQASPTEFQPLDQVDRPAQLFLYLRSVGPPDQLVLTVRRTMQQLDPSLPLLSLRTMDAQIEDSLSNERLISILAVCFGVLATLLAGVGLYGVLAFTTTQRTREIGIRIALGSPRAAVARLVLTDVLRLTALGIAVALPVAFALARLLRSELFGVSPADPFALAAAVAIIAVTALLAALIRLAALSISILCKLSERSNFFP
jgi:putative ABC transport system permease protein